jgi:hypothetical protein
VRSTSERIRREWRWGKELLLFQEFRLLRRKNSARVVKAARKINAPNTVPTMAPTDFFTAPAVADVADGEALAVLVTFFEGGDEDVDVGSRAVEDGERSLRHVLSFDTPTVFMSELPP